MGPLTTYLTVHTVALSPARSLGQPSNRRVPALPTLINPRDLAPPPRPATNHHAVLLRTRHPLKQASYRRGDPPQCLDPLDLNNLPLSHRVIVLDGPIERDQVRRDLTVQGRGRAGRREVRLLECCQVCLESRTLPQSECVQRVLSLRTRQRRIRCRSSELYH